MVNLCSSLLLIHKSMQLTCHIYSPQSSEVTKLPVYLRIAKILLHIDKYCRVFLNIAEYCHTFNVLPSIAVFLYCGHNIFIENYNICPSHLNVTKSM